MQPATRAGTRTGTVRDRFVGRIIGLGTTSGTRLVVGNWAQSPFGRFTDVFVAHPGGRRQLLAPSQEVAEYVGATYQFDDVLFVPVTAAADLEVSAGPLDLSIRFGERPPIGRLLRAVPGRLATSTWFSRASDPFARVLMPGVRTYGTAGGGRREWYAATDLHLVSGVRARWEGEDLGGLADVHPEPGFGFGSTPRRPMVTRLTTIIERRVDAQEPQR